MFYSEQMKRRNLRALAAAVIGFAGVAGGCGKTSAGDPAGRRAAGDAGAGEVAKSQKIPDTTEYLSS